MILILNVQTINSNSLHSYLTIYFFCLQSNFLQMDEVLLKVCWETFTVHWHLSSYICAEICLHELKWLLIKLWKHQKWQVALFTKCQNNTWSFNVHCTNMCIHCILWCSRQSLSPSCKYFWIQACITKLIILKLVSFDLCYN